MASIIEIENKLLKNKLNLIECVLKRITNELSNAKIKVDSIGLENELLRMDNAALKNELKELTHKNVVEDIKREYIHDYGMAINKMGHDIEDIKNDLSRAELTLRSTEYKIPEGLSSKMAERMSNAVVIIDGQKSIDIVHEYGMILNEMGHDIEDIKNDIRSTIIKNRTDGFDIEGKLALINKAIENKSHGHKFDIAVVKREIAAVKEELTNAIINDKLDVNIKDLSEK